MMRLVVVDRDEVLSKPFSSLICSSLTTPSELKILKEDVEVPHFIPIE